MIDWLCIDWNDTLSMNLVPFRSAAWSNMPRSWKLEAMRFAREDLWPLLLKQRTPKLAICFGAASAKVLREVLSHSQCQHFPVGWGRVRADVSESGGTVVIRLPHLSRYRIFKRAQGLADLKRLREALRSSGVVG